MDFDKVPVEVVRLKFRLEQACYQRAQGAAMYHCIRNPQTSDLRPRRGLLYNSTARDPIKPPQIVSDVLPANSHV